MDLNIFHAITGRLEASKAAGWLSEYLVAWHGLSGQLKPEVTVWRAAGVSDGAAHRYVGRALAGLVGSKSIYIAHP